MSTSTPASSMTVSTVCKRYRRRLFAAALMALASSGCSKGQDTKEAHLAQANVYFAAAQYDKAEKGYREVLRLRPDDPVGSAN